MRPAEGTGRSGRAEAVHVRFVLRYSDLYWMFVTTWVTPPLLLLALLLLTSPLQSDLRDPGSLALLGAGILVLAVVIYPVMLMNTSGAKACVGYRISLRISAQGVDGWPPAERWDVTWKNLHRPRIESRVIVLPFHPTLCGRRCWMVIPKRALTPEASARLVALLREQGFLRPGRRPKHHGTHHWARYRPVSGGTRETLGKPRPISLRRWMP